uniref:Uncharacterized protein n=1 Tax=Rhizophora mucronata TaxID=61149 RepID=A0A2P2JV97_RHIMU
MLNLDFCQVDRNQVRRPHKTLPSKKYYIKTHWKVRLACVCYHLRYCSISGLSLQKAPAH